MLALVVGDSALIGLTSSPEHVVGEDGVALPFAWSSRDDVIVCLLDYQEELVLELLLRTAVKNRLQLDAWEQQRPEMSDGSKMFLAFARLQVGELKIGDAEWAPMPLREGCNKIIHADRYDFPMTKASDGVGALTHGFVETVGTNRRTPWQSRLDVVRYVRASVYNAYGGFDFPRGWMTPPK